MVAKRQPPNKPESPKHETLPAIQSSLQFSEDAGGGFEEADASAYAIPFISILQSNSPQVKKSEPAYIKGAEEGDFYNNVSGEVLKAPLVVVPCLYQRVFNEWKQRTSGGGFAGAHRPSEALSFNTSKNDKGQDVLANGNILRDTRNHFCLVRYPDGKLRPAVLSFASTQLKKSRKWMTLMEQLKGENPETKAMFTLPMFAAEYSCEPVAESNDQGSWMGWEIKLQRVLNLGQPLDLNTYVQARAFRDAVRGAIDSGTLQTATPPSSDPAAGSEGDAF